MSFNIAIDGPAGAGKSTIARKVASELSFIYVDTGAMYRAMALYCLQHQIALTDEGAVSDACPSIDVQIRYENQEQHILLNDRDVSREIRREEVGNAASTVSAYRAVREKLTELQKTLAASTDIVMDGRDIGTSVLPDADVKIYLTASAHTRALRRFHELEEKGITQELDKIEADINERDQRDMTRKISPLCQAEDAVLIDSSDLGIPEVTEAIIAIVKERR